MYIRSWFLSFLIAHDWAGAVLSLTKQVEMKYEPLERHISMESPNLSVQIAVCLVILPVFLL